VKDGADACDGTDFGTSTCATALGYAAAGSLKCNADCSLDLSACGACRDGHKNVNEQCDGTDFGFGGVTCAIATNNPGASGAVACTSSCTYDTSACGWCGDGKRNFGELCDGADLGGQTCASAFAPGATGTLGCNASCAGWDTTACVAPTTSCGDASGLQAGAPWPMRGGCPGRQGQSPNTTLVSPTPWSTLTEKWSVPLGGLYAPGGGAYPASSSPAIGADGTIYVGSGDKNLYAISPSGTVVWTFATNGFVFSSPAIGRDGTIYVGSADGHLYAVSPSGHRVWSFAVPNAGNYLGAIDSSPAIAGDGTIYFESGGNAYAVNPDGTQRWSAQLEYGYGASVGSPAIGPDNTIYFADYAITALHPDGSVAWRVYGDGTSTWSSPTVAADGTIYGVYASYYAANLRALDPSSGTPLWSAAVSSWYNELSPSLAIGPKGIIAAGGDIVDASGQSLLRASTMAYASSVFSANGWLLAPLDVMTIVREEASTIPGPKLSSLGIVYSSPAIGAGGVVYVVSQDGKLHAMGP
jgi:outer membrane protein assembly factor BamB